MGKKEMDQKLMSMFELAKELADAPIPVVKYRAEMVLGLFQELMVTVVDKE